MNIYFLSRFYEKLLDKTAGRQALKQIFCTNDRDLVKILMSAASPQMSQQYSTKVLHFFNKLFQTTEKCSSDPSLNQLCSSMSKLANVEPDKLLAFLRHVIIGSSNMMASNSSANVLTSTAVTIVKTPVIDDPKQPDSCGNQWSVSQVVSIESNAPSPSPTIQEQKSLIQENSQLLQALTNFIVRLKNNEEVSLTVLKALIPVAKCILSPSLDGVGFTDLINVMVALADAGTGRGHVYLFPSAIEWLEICKNHLTEKEIVDKLGSESNGNNCVILEAACCILDYLAEVVNGLTGPMQTVSFRALSPPWEGESPFDQV